MNNLLLPLAALLCLSFSVQAQKINGVLLQADGKAAEYATITLHQAADSSLVKGAITGASGEFEFSGIESGSYLLKGSQIGATDTWAPAFEYDGAELKLEPFRLADNTQEISEVTVVARVPGGGGGERVPGGVLRGDAGAAAGDVVRRDGVGQLRLRRAVEGRRP